MAKKPGTKKRRRRLFKKPPPKFTTTNIDLDKCKPDVPDVYLSAVNGEQAQWSSAGGSFAVVFISGSPFAQTVFVVPDGGTVSSGQIINTAIADYPYKVFGDSGCVQDPIIHIGP